MLAPLFKEKWPHSHILSRGNVTKAPCELSHFGSAFYIQEIHLMVEFNFYSELNCSFGTQQHDMHKITKVVSILIYQVSKCTQRGQIAVYLCLVSHMSSLPIRHCSLMPGGPLDQTRQRFCAVEIWGYNKAVLVGMNHILKCIMGKILELISILLFDFFIHRSTCSTSESTCNLTEQNFLVRSQALSCEFPKTRLPGRTQSTH